jgi:hypothetical protein
LQKRMAETLRGFLDLEIFDSAVVKNALLTINNLSPQFPVTSGAHEAVVEGIRKLKCQTHDLSDVEDSDGDSFPRNAKQKPGLEDIAMQQGITKHNVRVFWDMLTGQLGTGTPGPMEEGEVGDERGGREEAGAKRRRGGNDDLADARPVARPRSGGPDNGHRGMPPHSWRNR